MADIFISYSTADQEFSDFVARHLSSEGVSVFQAGVSLDGGDKWSDKILRNLKAAPMVLFLASKAACQSAAVQQEIGAALITDKKLVPIIWDIDPNELPAWTQGFQAIDLKHLSADQIKQKFSAIASKIKIDNRTGGIVAVCLLAGLIFLTLKD